MKTLRSQILVIVAVILVVVVAARFLLSLTSYSPMPILRFAETWIDLDRDGIRDGGEPPMGGVQFYVYDTQEPETKVGTYRTDSDGFAFFSFQYTRLFAQYEIEAVVPEGFDLTTKSPVNADDTDKDGHYFYEFGFAPIEP